MSESSVEHVRPRLERLRNTLRHWQICSTEYESLRRQILTLSPKASREDVGKLTKSKLAVGAGFNGKLVDKKEVKSLLGDELGIKRTVAQVITEINHRIDYTQTNVIKFEQQIEQGENEIDENEQDEEDEYEDEDPKYKPTAEGLVSPELRMELEEFQRRIKERGEAARAEEAKWTAEENNKPKKRRKGGVRFAVEPEVEVPAAVTEPLPLPALAETTKDTIPTVEDPLVTGTNDKPEVLEEISSSKVVGVDLTVEDDEDARLQYSIAEEARRSSLTAPIKLASPYSAPTPPSSWGP